MQVLEVGNPHSLSRTEPVRQVVLHAMGEFVLDEGRAQHCTELLHRLRLSAHMIALPDGRLLRLVPTNRVAYHALGHNANSVGIEFALQGTHTYDTFLAGIRVPDWPTPAQLEAGRAWVQQQLEAFGLAPSAVTTHHLLDPERKADPGVGFPLGVFLAQLHAAA